MRGRGPRRSASTKSSVTHQVPSPTRRDADRRVESHATRPKPALERAMCLCRLRPATPFTARKRSPTPLQDRENRAAARFVKPSAGLEPATPSLPWRSRHRCEPSQAEETAAQRRIASPVQAVATGTSRHLRYPLGTRPGKRCELAGNRAAAMDPPRRRSIQPPEAYLHHSQVPRERARLGCRSASSARAAMLAFSVLTWGWSATTWPSNSSSACS